MPLSPSRRQAIFALAALPLGAQQDALPVITSVAPEVSASGVVKFFTPLEHRTLATLCGLLMPGAMEARVPEFLDFYIGVSPADRQTLYRQGLRQLAGLNDANAQRLLAPLREKWTYHGPASPLGQFLRAAKNDVLAATYNSLEFAQGKGARPRTSYYWKPLD